MTREEPPRADPRRRGAPGALPDEQMIKRAREYWRRHWAEHGDPPPLSEEQVRMLRRVLGPLEPKLRVEQRDTAETWEGLTADVATYPTKTTTSKVYAGKVSAPWPPEANRLPNARRSRECPHRHRTAEAALACAERQAATGQPYPPPSLARSREDILAVMARARDAIPPFDIEADVRRRRQSDE